MSVHRILCALSVVLGLCIIFAGPSPTSAGYVDEITASSPVAYWRLDDSDSTAVDSVGGNNGTYDGPTPGSAAGVRPTDLIAGKFALGMPADNNAVNFTNDNGAILATSSALDSPETGSWSVEMFYKPNSDSPGAFQELMAKGECCTGLPSIYILNWGPGNTVPQNTIRPGVNAAGPPDAVDSTSALPNDEWSHVAATFDASSAELSVYINGEPKGSATLPNPINPSPGAPFVIGGLQLGGIINQAHGVIDEVSYYGRALGAGEVADHFNAAVVPEPHCLMLLALGAIMMFATVGRRTSRS